MPKKSVIDMLTSIEASSTSTIVVHTLPPIMHDHAGPQPTSRIMLAGDLVAEIGGVVQDNIAVTLAEPASPVTLEMDRQQLIGWLEQAGRMASDEDGSGILIGYDPLRPERRAEVSPTRNDIMVTSVGALVWDGNAAHDVLFEWKDVAALSANRDEESAMILLADGRSVFLHADVDWDNRLS